MHVYPISFFEDRRFKIDPKLCFVLMPFKEPWSERVHNAIKEIVEELGYNCRRADDLYGRVILWDVWQSINEAAFVIADLTSDNPNVYYELGLAHALGKEIIPLLQKGSDIPFDQRPFRILNYEDNLDGRRQLEKELGEWMRNFKYQDSPEVMIKNEMVSGFNEWRKQGRPVKLGDEDFGSLNLNGIDFSNCQLSQTSFFESKLLQADASGSLLIRANLANSSWREANLLRSNISEADLSSADFTSANLSGAIALRTCLRDAVFNDANVKGLTIDVQTYERYKEVFDTAKNSNEIIIEQ